MNTTSKEQFIKQCKALIKTLNTYKGVEGKSFDMEDWISECGTVCCICGWQAVSEELGDFPRGSKAIKGKPDDVSYVNNIAGEIGYDLQGYNWYVGRSIYLVEPEDRQDHAFLSALFTGEELQHPHLTTKSSFEDAIDYLELIVTKLEK